MVACLPRAHADGSRPAAEAWAPPGTGRAGRALASGAAGRGPVRLKQPSARRRWFSWSPGVCGYFFTRIFCRRKTMQYLKILLEILPRVIKTKHFKIFV